MSDWKKLGGLKAGETKEGEFMLYGRFTYFLNMVILPNKTKQTEADPDYLILVKENEQAQGNPDAASRSPRQRAADPPDRRPAGIPRNGKGRQPRKHYGVKPGTLPGLPLPPPDEGQPF